jgi:DNA processing protein
LAQRKLETTQLTDAFTGPTRLTDEERLGWLRLIRTENVGPITFHDLITHFGSAGTALEAIPTLRQRGGGRQPGRIGSEADAIREMKAAKRAGVQIIAAVEADYPPLLREIEGAPPLIFTKGQVELAARRTVAIVGSRSASSAGRQLAGDLVRVLGDHGVVIVSGLARGIDTAAHQAGLPTGTIAVLAGGLDVVYPPENTELHTAIAEQGLLLSECPLGFAPRGQDFPRRNRIVSGVSVGVVVIEAAVHSGSLITARLALEQNRELFAVPGHPLDPRATGTNELIKNGAHLVVNATDILQELPPIEHYDSMHGGSLRGFQEPDATPIFKRAPHTDEPSPRDRHKVIEALSFTPVSSDTLLRATGLSPRSLAIALLELDLAGRIERHGNQYISLRADYSG